MTVVNKNEATASRRTVTVRVFQDDGVSPADKGLALLANTFIDPGNGVLVAAAGTIVNKRKPLAFADLTFGTVTVNPVNTVGIAAHGLQTGDGAERLTTTGALPTGLTVATDYWMIVVDPNTVAFASSLATAYAGTKLSLTSVGSGTNKITNTGATSQRGLDSEFLYTLTQAETNLAVNEIVVVVEKPGYLRCESFVTIRDLTDVVSTNVATIADAAVASIWSGPGAILEGSFHAADLLRLANAMLAAPASDFQTNTIVVKSLDGSKIRCTIAVTTAGRQSFTPGDLT